MRARVPVISWLLVLVVLVGVVAWQGNNIRVDRRDKDRRSEAVSIAKAQVLDLTTLDSDTVGLKVKRLSARTSGSFKNEISTIANSFVQVVREKKVTASGSIDAAGVTSFSTKKATVVVASTAAVVQGKQKPSTRSYRIRVKLAWSKKDWKITEMEFVQ